MSATSYNGWANYATWNVALWLGNDENIYSLARRAYNYETLADELSEFGVTETPDGISFTDPDLDVARLNEWIGDDF